MMKQIWYALAGVGAALVLAGYIAWGYLPLARQLHQRRQALAVKEQELSDARSLMERYGEYQERAIRIRTEAKRLVSRLPATPEIPELLRSITRIAAECNIREFQFVPMTPTAKNELTELPIHLNVTCRYHALGQFLTRLGYLPRLVSARDVKITGRDKTGKNESVSADVVLVTYVLAP